MTVPSHAECSSCDHDHDHNWMPLRTRWIFSVLTVLVLLVLLRPFMIEKMYFRANAYALSARHNDAIRICKRIVFLDRYAAWSWTRLGFAYIDAGLPQDAIPAFEKDIALNPQDKTAAFYELGQAYFLKKDYAEAIKYFQLVRSGLAGAKALSNADVLKYHQNISGFQNVYDMGALLRILVASYKLSGDMVQADRTQKEYEIYKSKGQRILF